uniref:Uncharacterized protein n=1 Tax=Meloidogyne enterolobii TaxID=390850 RepID=A0A6V7XER8_MELEN|nr:unnamed protein product [Meloidogyne enterolobii]
MRSALSLSSVYFDRELVRKWRRVAENSERNVRTDRRKSVGQRRLKFKLGRNKVDFSLIEMLYFCYFVAKNKLFMT